jgi:hypothetical protein
LSSELSCENLNFNLIIFLSALKTEFFAIYKPRRLPRYSSTKPTH